MLIILHVFRMLIRSESGLPFFDVLLIKDLPKSASLPVATVQTTKELLRDGNRWSTLFDYVYFTESDQVLHSYYFKFTVTV